ncbi:MAG TPA: ABC transporter ATP-binding protein [Planctomycetota bacterium]|nr:ABC transporter ATP-binding protein [Planctomycetota bacterium]HRR80844.1 ABC transporter ATP-binding protein [Planctomycetota bacterium]HRT95977.1 ABC transporter ATP-binding protein [Planctomycetota bacterium]
MPEGRGNLHVEGVTKSFDGTPVLREVSLAVAGGEFVTLVGPSGCGKTTLIRIIAGLELADAGSVILSGHDITRLPAHRRSVNTVFQDYALFPHLSVFENVAFGLRSRKVPQAEVARRVGAALDLLRLGDFARRHPHQLSGGQKQRVALARALVNEPEVLLLDEPMSALDAKLRGEVRLELRRLQRQLGRAFLLVTHDQDEAMTVSDRLFVMREGQIEQSGPPAAVYERPRTRFVAEFLGSANLIPGTASGGSVETRLGALTPRCRPLWEEGTLAIRPERVRLCKERPAANAVRARVREVIYCGDHVDLFMEPGPLRVRAEPAAALRIGDDTWLELPADHLEALDG